MTAERLVRLYPRAWRNRYGDEFVTAFGAEPLSAQQVIDIVSGAIDAWLSSDVRRAMAAAGAGEGGTIMSARAWACVKSTSRYTTRDGLIGAGVMLVATLVSVALGVAARHRGWAATGEMLTSLAFPVSLTLSMPFWILKGQPWKAQAALVGGTMGLLFVIAYVSTLI